MTTETGDVSRTAGVESDGLENSVSLMARVGASYGPAFSPDGSRLSILSNLTGVFQVWTVPVGGGWPQLVTPLDDWITKVVWSPDGAWIAFNMAPGGGMNQQVYVVRPDGSDLRLLTDGGQENNWLGLWTPDSKQITIASNRQDPTAMDIYLAEVDSGEMRLAVKNQGTGRVQDISPDGKRLILQRSVHRSDDNLYLVNLETGTETLLTPHDGPGNFHIGKFAADDRTIYLTSDQNRDRVAFARIRLAADGQPGAIETLTAREDADLDDLAVARDGSRVALVWNASGRNELGFFDCSAGESQPGTELPAECILDVTYSLDGRYLAMTLTGAAAPSDVWVLDSRSGSLTQITHSPHPGVDLNALVRPNLVQFTAHDGLELSGWMYLPQKFQRPGPVVLDFHGGPEGQAQPVFNSTYQALLQQGIAVLAPNVRGSSGFGKRFVNLDNGSLRFDAVRDIKACVDYVVGSGIADPGRIGISGGSYGGYMTMAGLTEYPDLFAAGANLFGIVNFATFFEQTEPWMAAISKIEYGDPETEADMLRDLSPIHKIDRVTAPTLVLHGANDTNVPVIEAEQVVEQLQQRGVSVDYVLFPDEGHGFVKAPNRITSAVAIVRWFKQHLGE